MPFRLIAIATSLLAPDRRSSFLLLVAAAIFCLYRRADKSRNLLAVGIEPSGYFQPLILAGEIRNVRCRLFGGSLQESSGGTQIAPMRQHWVNSYVRT